MFTGKKKAFDLLVATLEDYEGKPNKFVQEALKKHVRFVLDIYAVEHLSLVLGKSDFRMCDNKGVEISCSVTTQLISVFVFVTHIVQAVFFLNLKFHVSSHLL